MNEFDWFVLALLAVVGVIGLLGCCLIQSGVDTDCDPVIEDVKVEKQIKEIKPQLDVVACSDCSKNKAKEICQACSKPLCLKCISSWLVICKSRNPEYAAFPIQMKRCKFCTDRNNVSFVAKYL
jgi:hypothetical protein